MDFLVIGQKKTFACSGIRSDLCIRAGGRDEFCMGSGEGYSFGSTSLPHGRIDQQSPATLPELFSCISYSYEGCLGLDWLSSLQT